MLDANIKAQLKTYLEKLQRPIELVASLDDSAKAEEMHALLGVRPYPSRVRCATLPWVAAVKALAGKAGNQN